MKYPVHYKNHIRGLVQYLRREFYFQEWTFHLKWDTEEKESPKESVAATIQIDDRYINATICCYPPTYKAYKSGDSREVAEIIIHEMCHIFTEPLYNISVNAISNRESETLEDVRERQTQRITNVLLSYIPKSVYIIKHQSNARRKSKPRRTARKRN